MLNHLISSIQSEETKGITTWAVWGLDLIHDVWVEVVVLGCKASFATRKRWNIVLIGQLIKLISQIKHCIECLTYFTVVFSVLRLKSNNQCRAWYSGTACKTIFILQQKHNTNDTMAICFANALLSFDWTSQTFWGSTVVQASTLWPHSKTVLVFSLCLCGSKLPVNASG